VIASNEKDMLSKIISRWLIPDELYIIASNIQTGLFSESPEHIDNLLPRDGVVEIYFSFFNRADSDRLFQKLLATIDWKQDRMKIYGREVKLPRLTAWYGENNADYSYSGIDMKSKPWTKELLEIKNKVESHSKINFTHVLLNRYRSGNDSVSWHRDNEKVLRVNPVIASVSFGAARVFKFRHVNNHNVIRSVELHHGTYVLMTAETQHKWEHAIPKSKSVTGERISLTFRVLF